MIKVINLISLIMAPIIVVYKDDQMVTIAIALVLLASVVFVVRRSKRPPAALV